MSPMAPSGPSDSQPDDPVRFVYGLGSPIAFVHENSVDQLVGGFLDRSPAVKIPKVSFTAALSPT